MTQKHHAFPRAAALLTGLLLLLAVTPAGGAAVAETETPDGSLYLELTYANGAVTGMTLYDAAGEPLLTGADAGDAAPEESLEAMLSQIIQAGYLAGAGNEPYLFVTVSGDDPDGSLAVALRAAAGEYLATLATGYRVGGAALDADTAAKAAALGLPGGRYRMMAYIAEQQGVTVQEAVRMYGDESVQALMRTFVGLRAAMGDDEDGADESNGNGYGAGLENEQRTQEQLETQEREEDRTQTAEKQQTKKESNGNGNAGEDRGNGKK